MLVLNFGEEQIRREPKRRSCTTEAEQSVYLGPGAVAAAGTARDLLQLAHTHRLCPVPRACRHTTKSHGV